MRLLAILALLVLTILGFSSAFVVTETEKAILFRLGKIIKSDYEPGLHFKIPFIYDVKKFDDRIQTLDAQPETYLTVEKKYVVVDSFVQWKISNVETFYKSMRGDMDTAQNRIVEVVKTGLRNEFGKRVMHEVISGERSMIMDNINIQANKDAISFGIEVVDVRIKRTEFPPAVSDKVFRRMETERSRIAKDLRAQGNEKAATIRADADRQVTIIVADAYKESEQLRGEGDAEAARIYAEAYQQDPEFYAFYRSINAYKNSFGKTGDMMVLEPDSSFFNYFREEKGN